MKAPAPLPLSDSIQVGSFFLETLTTGMYENPFDSVREYIQNAFDALRDAVARGLVKSDEARILVGASGTSRSPSLTIRDNGVGLPLVNAVTTLISLGASHKQPAVHAGFRGIGRLAGIAYCSKLRFTTKYAGENQGTVVEFDCGLLRGHFSPGATPIDVRKVVADAVTTRVFDERESEHYTEVELMHLVNLGQEFVQPDKLLPYLRQVCPVEYQDEFELADRVRALATTQGETLPTVHVEFRQKKDRLPILKPFRNSYATSKPNVFSKVHSIEVFSNKELGWFGWVGISNFPGEILDSTVAGVRFRSKNIQIGSAEIIESIAEELTTQGTERRLMPWAVGEIFITNTLVVPNARRDGFEDGRAWREVRRDVKDQVVRRIVKLVRSASTTRSLLKRLKAAFERQRQRIPTGALIPELKADIQAEIQKSLKTLEDPDKVIGADPKEVSALISKFKELSETVEAMEVFVPEAEEETGEQDAGGGNGEGRDGDASSDEGDEEEDDVEGEGAGEGWDGTMLVVYQVLKEELGEEQAKRLIRLISERLAQQ